MVYLPYTDKVHYSENVLVDIKIFKTNGQPKFSLALIKDNKRIVCFDNHEGRKPHKHIKNKVYDYEFENVDKLIEDFYEAIKPFLES